MYFIGNAMQVMAAAWLMVELTGSSFLAALVQTAVFLPMFLLSLPAGVLADITDRRRLILAALLMQAARSRCCRAAVRCSAGPAPARCCSSPSSAGCCTALLSPAWNSAVADAVPRDELPQAITAVSIAYNSARALGPGAGRPGLRARSAAAGSSCSRCVSTLVMYAGDPPLAADSRIRPRACRPSGCGAACSARCASRATRRPCWRSWCARCAYSAAGSALWALLPVIGQRQLGLGAAGFGLLMGCLGAGAVRRGLVIGRVRARLGLELLVAGGCVVFARGDGGGGAVAGTRWLPMPRWWPAALRG